MFTKSNIASVLSILMIMGILQCAVQQDTHEEYTFSWDMSAENHTGKSKKMFFKDGKHRGMSVFHWRKDLDESLNQLIKNNIECIALIPFLDQKSERSMVRNNHEEIGKWTRRDSSFMLAINKIQERELHIMLKPHVWLHDGWRSNIQMDTKAEWDTWFESYSRHMIHYAMLAEHMNIELLCIGAEFKTSILAQPEKWNSMIGEIRNIYKGKLTYAANWDGEFREVKFWDQMDYIGIQAYFPLTNEKNPSLAKVKEGWKRHLKLLEELSKKYNKPILFTETGYRSDETATIEPWVWDSKVDQLANPTSNHTQNIAYEALFQQLWDKKWFAGTYFWQWHNESTQDSQYDKRDFTPRFKPAENTMAKWYGKMSD